MCIRDSSKTINVGGEKYTPGRFLGWGSSGGSGKGRLDLKFNPLASDDSSEAFVVRIERVGGKVDVVPSWCLRWRVSCNELIALAAPSDYEHWDNLISFLKNPSTQARRFDRAKDVLNFLAKRFIPSRRVLFELFNNRTP